MADSEGAAGPPRPVDCGLKGLCPRCGSPTLFDGWIKFAKRCRVCGLQFSTFNVGDGPAAFLTLVLGSVIVALAVVVELTFHPQWWLHAILWVPLTLAGVILSLRLAKGWLLALEYRNAAREGRVDR